MSAEPERLVRDEAEAAREADLPTGQGKRVNRGRSTVYSVRLTDDAESRLRAMIHQEVRAAVHEALAS